jgi:hypothetical protein
MIDLGTAEKLQKFVKLLTSDQDGEVVAAARAICRALRNAGSDIHEFADRLRSGARLSEAERRKIYEAGVKDGKNASAKFSDVDGPSYYEMAIRKVDGQTPHSAGRQGRTRRGDGVGQDRPEGNSAFDTH